MFKGGEDRRVFVFLNEEKVSFSGLILQSNNPIYLRLHPEEQSPRIQVPMRILG